MQLKTLRNLDLKHKKVVIRTDLNVSLDEESRIIDDYRIRSALITIEYVQKQECKIILVSHLGRPGGEVVSGLSLFPIAQKLSELLGVSVPLVTDNIETDVQKRIAQMHDGDIILLENIRFYEGEENPEEHPNFVNCLAELGDVYIQDAFATLHRKHASTYYVISKCPEVAAGLLVEKEVLILTNLLTQAKEPFYTIIGGSKISSKIGILEALIARVDGLFIGGAMAFTFLKAKNIPIGNSLFDEEHLDTAKHIIKRCYQKGIDLRLPADFVITKTLSPHAETKTVSIEEGIPEGWFGADIGEKTVAEWRTSLLQASTIFWNGPVGVFEMEPFAGGTQAIANILAETKSMTIIGGGDSAAAVYKFNLQKKMTCISTGGGASLEFIEENTLPGLEVLAEH